MHPPQTSTGRPFTGRFAPSPTGPLHAGSLIAALASYLHARAAGGRWLVRMEDLDPPRETPQAARDILRTLEALGLHWDDEVLYQSRRHAAYRAALERLRALDLSYPCDCSRQQIQAAGAVYSGRCRRRRDRPTPPCAIRCKVEDRDICFDDLFQGFQCFNLARDCGDFVVRRKDGYFAYQLAVVVDDAFQGVTHVVRGVDLLDSTPRQIHLQRALGLPTPVYGHIPVIINAHGQKLSKQQLAAPLDARDPGRMLLTGLRYLRQDLDPGLTSATPDEILRWAVAHWQPDRLLGLTQLREFVRAESPGV